MYQYEFINKLEQFGSVNYELILTDDEKEGRPDIRIPVKFSSKIKFDFDSFAQDIIDRAVAEQDSDTPERKAKELAEQAYQKKIEASKLEEQAKILDSKVELKEVNSMVAEDIIDIK